jgi:thiamine-monophosphate kinase
VTVTGEFERIARLAARLGAGAAGVEIGIGDDAAVLAPPAGQRLVWTIDAQVDGVHFRRDLLAGWRDAGWRSYMAAASDLAAMGASPWCALSALELPASIDDDALDEIAIGQRAAADRVGAPVVGGNLSRATALAITTTLLGTAAAPITRAGARPGDGLWLSGPVGLAAAGLRALEGRVQDARIEPAVSAWRTPIARIADGLALAGRAHAAIDISDGLARDLEHLAVASGVRAVLDARLLEAHGGDALAGAAEAVGARALDLALAGGEDYALLAASPDPIPGFTRIGEIRDGGGKRRGESPRLVLRTAAGEEELAPRGFDHFGG